MDNERQARVAHLLASYGADRARWPEADRDLPAADGDARREAAAIDRLLSLASDPAVPAGAELRLMQKIADPRSAAVVALAARRPPRAALVRYAAALPLAASLALGVYLGARGSLDFMLPPAITGDVAQGDDALDALDGIGDIDSFAEDSLT
jgi:hypothetical protein